MVPSSYDARQMGKKEISWYDSLGQEGGGKTWTSFSNSSSLWKKNKRFWGSKYICEVRRGEGRTKGLVPAG